MSVNDSERIIAGLQLRIKALKRERDLARQMYCLDRCARYSMPDHETWHLEARKLAESKGWDCFR